MKLVALISGGKDSIYNILECIRCGHQVVALAHLFPKLTPFTLDNQRSKIVQLSPIHSTSTQLLSDELNSYLFQTVGSNVASFISKALNLPLFIQELSKGSHDHSKNFQISKALKDGNDETLDLFLLLKKVQNSIPEIQGVTSGVILSNYQRLRIEQICNALNLQTISYLWERNQSQLLKEMIKSKIDARIWKCSSYGLGTSVLYKSISELESLFQSLEKTHGLNVCGEGGEYETITLDCPLYQSKIIASEMAIYISSDNDISPVASILPCKFSLKPKLNWKSPLNNLLIEEKQNYCDFIKSLTIAQSLHIFQKSSRSFHPVDHRIINNQSDLFKYLNITGDFNSVLTRFDTLIHPVNHHIVFVGIFLQNMLQFQSFNKIYKSIVQKKNNGLFPSRFCIELKWMKEPVQLSCIYSHYANNKLSSNETLQSKIPNNHNIIEQKFPNLHVRSISRWAPACIGPYAQSKTAYDLVFCAGQIALYPATQQMIQESKLTELLCCIKHISSVLKSSHSSLENVLVYIVYTLETLNENEIRYLDVLIEKSIQKSVWIQVIVSRLPRNAQIEVVSIATRNQSTRLFSASKTEILWEEMVSSSSTVDQGKSPIEPPKSKPQSLVELGINNFPIGARDISVSIYHEEVFDSSSESDQEQKQKNQSLSESSDDEFGIGDLLGM